MTPNLKSFTKTELLAYIEEIETEHKHTLTDKNDEIEMLHEKLEEGESVLRTRVDRFADAIKKPYPDLHHSLLSALDNQLFWIDDPPTGFITAAIPRAAIRVRWAFVDGSLEFEYPNISGLGTHWSTPLTGDTTEDM